MADPAESGEKSRDVIRKKEVYQTPADYQTRYEELMKRASMTMDRFESGPEKDIRDYLRECNPRLVPHYEQFKVGLAKSLVEFAYASRGTSIEAYARTLVEDFSENFDRNMLTIFQKCRLDKNPLLVERILKNTDLPLIIPAASLPVHMYGATAIGGPRGTSIHGVNIPPNSKAILMSADFTDGYEAFKTAVIHEFGHFYIQNLNPRGYAQNRALFEGITEMLAEEVGATSASIYVYGNTTELARVLYEIDPDALITWYSGGYDSLQYRSQLYKKLEPGLGPDEANGVLNDLFAVSKKVFEPIQETTEKLQLHLIDMLPFSTREQKQSIAMLVVNFINREISVEQLRVRFKKISGIWLGRNDISAISDAREDLRASTEEFYTDLIQGLRLMLSH